MQYTICRRERIAYYCLIEFRAARATRFRSFFRERTHGGSNTYYIVGGNDMTREISILVADADSSVRSIIKLSALAEGWRCDEASDGISVLKRLRHSDYDLAILDTRLPELDGKIVCRYLRKTSQLPVIFISKDQKEEDRLSGFAVGGNDFVPKPFYPRELMARVKNLLKLCERFDHVSKTITAGALQIDIDSHCAHAQGRKLQLTPKEYDLILFLCQNPNQAFSRDALLNLVWGHEFVGTDRTVDTHVKSLRSKIHPLQHYIETIWGFGYRFEPTGKEETVENSD